MRPLNQDLTKAFNISTANREVIFDRSLGNNNQKLQPIRRTLGFRETSSTSIPRPKFALHFIQELYETIDQLAKTHLPVNNIDDLRKAWKEGQLLRTEIRDLVRDHVANIWTHASAHQRRLYLLMKDEGDEYYSTDLFYTVAAHRSYIELQLEHLAYAKAISYWKNHYSAGYTRPKPRITLPAPMNTGRSNTLRQSSSTGSLVVVLSLSSEKLLKFLPESAGHSHSHEEPGDQTPHSRRRSRPMVTAEKDKANKNRYALRKSRRQREIDLSDEDEDNEENGDEDEDNEESGDEDDVVYVRRKRPRVEKAPVENEDDGMESQSTPMFARPNIHTVREVTSTYSDNSNTCVTDVNPNTGSHTKEDRADTQAGSDLEKLRLDLHVLLLEELRDITGTQVFKDANNMWEASEEINLALKAVWAADRHDNTRKMGEERYKRIDKAVDEWLVWRDITRKLGIATCVHPSQGLSLPVLTSEQWVAKLGGKREFKDLDITLATYRRHLGRSGSCTTEDDFTERLATALASVIKYSLGVEDFKTTYMEDLLRFNERLFSWELDFKRR